MRVRITFYNEQTGEIYEETDKVVIVGKKPFVRDRNFVKFFVAFLIDILEDEELGKGAWRLLIYAIRRMEYNSLRVYMVPEETARELGVSKRTFYNWVRTLTRKGYLEKIATNIYRIRPYTAIKGNMEETLKTEPDF
jgi:hypothetical protein